MATTTTKPKQPKQYNISNKTKDAILQAVRNQTMSCLGTNKRMSMLAIARQYYPSPPKYSQNCNSGKLELDNIKPPIAFKEGEELIGYLFGKLSNFGKLYTVHPLGENDGIASALGWKLSADADKFKHESEILTALRNLVIYNKGVLVTRWKSNANVVSVQQSINGDVGLVEAPYEGNDISAVSPYNTFYDTSVPASELSTDGGIAGWHELVGLSKLAKCIEGINPIYRTSSDINLAFHNNTLHNLSKLEMKYSILDNVAVINQGDGMDYFIPVINSNAYDTEELDAIKLSSGGSWFNFFGMASTTAKDDKQIQTTVDNHVLTHTYIRVADYTGLGLPTNVFPVTSIAKITILDNRHIIGVEPVGDLHYKLPISLLTIMNTGEVSSSPSYASNIVGMQNVSAGFLKARFAATKGAIYGRGIYDSRLIDKKHIESDSPTAKIPLKHTALMGEQIERAYRPIPLDMQGINQLMGNLGIIESYTSDLAGGNAAIKGGRVQGNKNDAEFAQLVSSGSARYDIFLSEMKLHALLPIMSMQLYNILQYGNGIKFIVPETGELTDFPIKEAREKMPYIKYDIGQLRANDVNIPTDVAMSLLNVIAQTPNLQQRYPIEKLFPVIVKQMGFDQLDTIKPLTEEEQATRVAQAQAQANPQPQQG